MLKKAIETYKNCQTRIFDNLENEFYNNYFNYKKKNNLTNFVALSKILREGGFSNVKKDTNEIFTIELIFI